MDMSIIRDLRIVVRLKYGEQVMLGFANLSSDYGLFTVGNLIKFDWF